MTGAGRGGTFLGAFLIVWALPTLFAPSQPLHGDVRLGAPAEAVRVPVLVALETVSPGRGGSTAAEAAWLHRLERGLERPEGGSPPLNVRGRFLLERESLDAGGSQEDEARLQEMALQDSLRFVVMASLTRLADRYSLEIRLLPAEGAALPLEHTVFEGEGVDGLAEIVDRAAGAVRRWVAESPVPPPSAGIAPLARPDEALAAPPETDAPAPVSGPPPEESAPEEVPVPVSDPNSDGSEGALGGSPEVEGGPGERADDAPREAAPEDGEPGEGGEPADEAPREEIQESPGPVRDEPSSPEGDPAAEVSFEEPGPAPDPRPRVVGIRIVGNRRIEADAVLGRIATRVGEPFEAARAREDVRRVFDLGFFRDVQVLASDKRDGKLVTFVVEENPVIRRVSVTGNEAIGAEEIKEQLTLTVGSTIDYPLILENEQRIEALYQSKGYYLAAVETKIESLSDDAVAVDFDVEEGRKLNLVEIDFQGNDHLEDSDLLKVMQTKPWRFYSRVTHYLDHSGLYAEPIFYQDLDAVRRLYMDEGFIRVRISEPEVIHDEKGLHVTVRIDEGPRFAVGDLRIVGDGNIDPDGLAKLLTLQPGETFNRSKLTEDVESLRSHYADQGFYFARVEPDMRIDHESRTVDCAFQVDKGDLYFVDRINVSGNTRTRDPVVRREIQLKEGALYSATALDRSRARVRRLGFFEEVSFETRPLDTPHEVEVDVEVVERPTGTFSFGAGVGSSNGFLVNASVRQDNLFGKGYQLNATADVGSENRNFYLRFTDPYVFGTYASLSSTLFNTEQEFTDFDQEVMGIDFTVGYPLDEGETRSFAGYSFTGRDITGADVVAASLVEREEFQERTTTSLVSLSLRRDTRDDVRFPKSGHVSGAAVEFAGLGGLSQFVRLEGRTTWFLPLRRWLGFESTFVVNSRAGYVFPLNDISDFDLPGCDGCIILDPEQVQPLTNIDTDLELPISERYFLGGMGAFQVRGFKQRSLGPRRTMLNQLGVGGPNRLFFPLGRDESGTCLPGNECNDLSDTDIDDFENLDWTDVIGGNKFFLVNFEMRFPISEDLGLEGMLFLDAGNAFAENESINPVDLRFGTGAGVQWFSPFGPVLLQIGFPLDRLEDEDSSVFEFSLGGASY